MVKWTKRISSVDNKYHYSLAHSSGKIGILSYDENSQGNTCLHLIGLDSSSGNIILSKVYHFKDIDQSGDILIAGAADGGFIISGKIYHMGLHNPVLFKVDSQGSLIWNQLITEQVRQNHIYNRELLLTPDEDIFLLVSTNEVNLLVK